MRERITSAAAIREAHVQKTEIRITLFRKWIECEVAAVVVCKRLFVSNQFSWRSTIVGTCSGIFRSPFEKDCVVRVITAAGFEIGGSSCIRAIHHGVELSETAGPALAELRMEREALETAFAPWPLTILGSRAFLMRFHLP